MIERSVGDDPQGGRLTGWFQHKIYRGAAVGPTEDLGDLLPLEDLAKAGLYITVQLVIKTF